MKKTSTSQGRTLSIVTLLLVFFSTLIWDTAFSQGNPNGTRCYEGPSTVCATCNLGYPDNSNLPRSAQIFNESEVLRAATPGPSSCGVTPTQIKAYYNDEHALVLGVRRVIIKNPNGSLTTTDYPITGTPAGPSCVTNPQVGTTIMTGDQSGNDVAVDGGRPLRPSLYITDLTVMGASSRAGDWQYGGTAVAPHQICGTWKGAVRTVDKSRNPTVVTIQPDANPPKNDWNIGGGQTPPAGLVNQGYGAVVIWNIADLNLIPGHTYRLQFTVHDGDQNKEGGDVGQACTIYTMPGGSTTPPNPATAKSVWSTNANGELTIRTTFAKNFVDNTYGSNAIGWTGGHTFSDLLNSDNLQMKFYDGEGKLKFEFKQDYFNFANGVYASGGVKTGDGDAITGDDKKVIAWKTAMDKNFNDNGYVLTTNSPLTNATYAPNAAYPNWDYDVWYELTFKKDAFGSKGFGWPEISNVHASPSKNGISDQGLSQADCPSNLLKVGNLVFDDKNNNGMKDLSEPGINGAAVRLYKDDNNDNVPDGAFIANTVTNVNGFYEFGGLAAGNYIVGVVLPYQTTLVATNGGDPDNDVDNDNNGTSTVAGEARSMSVSLGVDLEPNTDGDGRNGNLTVDFALVTNFGEIGDYVWNDLNEDGKQDANEPGKANIVVKLYNCAGIFIATTVTNETGYYEFENVEASAAGTCYKVQFPVPSQLPLGYVYTTKNKAGVPSNANSDANPATGITDNIILHAGEDYLDADAGIFDAGGTLPLNLLSFTGKYEAGISRLIWTTTNEINLDRFQVEHSGDGVNFNPLGSVTAKNGSANNTYIYQDKLVYPGMNYYRLKMLDKDGQFRFSNVVEIKVPLKGFNITGIFPSPFVDEVQIHVMAEKAGYADVTLVDNAGKVIRNMNVKISSGVNNIKIPNLGYLPTGMYILKVSSGDVVKTEKLIKD